jgi:hypothetical protein
MRGSSVVEIRHTSVQRRQLTTLASVIVQFALGLAAPMVVATMGGMITLYFDR